MRGMKAEGGWAVVCTEETGSIRAADSSPSRWPALGRPRYPALALMAEAVHEQGALAGDELCIGVLARESRAPAWRRSGRRIGFIYNNPVQARAMDKQDIRDLRRWHRDAARRSKTAGFDIVYVYATHDCHRASIPLRAATITAATNMAAASKIARGWCAK